MLNRSVKFDDLYELPIILDREAAHELNALLCGPIFKKLGPEAKNVVGHFITAYGNACTRKYSD